MKAVLRYSYIYNKVFNEKFTHDDLIKLKEDSKRFKILFEKKIDKIIELIEKHHSKEWKYHFIPVYIVMDAPYCFSDPLTIKFYKDEKMMLIILAHELLHNNFVGKPGFNNSEELHKYMEPILAKVVRGLKLNANKELKRFHKKTMDLARKRK